jgi:diamine N-acetyltransferase
LNNTINMDSTLSIRFADLEDINTIGFLAQQIWPKTYQEILTPDRLSYMLNLFYSPVSLRRQMAEDKHSFLVAEEDEEPMGFASWSEIAGSGVVGSDAVGTGVFKLHKLYVLPGRQGKGLGKAILEFILEDIRSQGATVLRLNVNRHNKARQFYEKMGFSVTGEEDVDIGNGHFMDDYIMELPI